MNKAYCILLLTIFIIGCSSEGTKVYKVQYKGNYPVGTFRASIGNSTVLTNGHDITEVHVKTPFDFFCYSVNKEVLCKSNINVKISEDAEKDFLTRYNIAKNNALAKNKTIITERIAFYVKDDKTEDVLTVNDFTNQSIEMMPIPLVGKGKTEEEAKGDALGKSKQLIAILRDKK